ncbi:hypothetical protein [Ktedonospora formicarum]|uniref:Uncharacterized protein n=1 Tax=Ktedonospora formicarum TaxID=2778364 RepID=A0A8J3IC41_9CHLR|nr:hypothetical protein [Ktedonospora formicarum]GHO49369.1 hypothetical protein KSX_75320 [Ktedonospora formicarum]
MLAASTSIGILVTLDAALVNEPQWIITLPVLVITLLFGGSVFSFPLVKHYHWFTSQYGWLGRLVYAIITILLIPGILNSDNSTSTYTIFGQRSENLWDAIIIIEGVFWLPMLVYEAIRWYHHRKPHTRLLKDKLH